MLTRVAVRLAVTVLVALALAPVATSAAQSSYSVIEIGPTAGFETTSGLGINQSGQVVGTLQPSSYYGPRSAFVWARSSGVRALGRFEGRDTVGGGINDRGEVAGTGLGGVYDPGAAFRWTATGGFERIGSGAPSGINNAREVSGTVLGPGPLYWDAMARPHALPGLVGTQGTANAINDRTQIVGYSYSRTGYPHPYVWDPRAGIRDIGTFLRDGTGSGVAYDINELGHVVGYTEGSDYSSRAFLWRDGRLTAVGPPLSYGYAVNNHDHVVGQFNAAGALRAFVSRGASFTNLNRLIPSGSGVVLTDARAINDTGWIVANGRNRQGGQRAFVLIPR